MTSLPCRRYEHEFIVGYDYVALAELFRYSSVPVATKLPFSTSMRVSRDIVSVTITATVSPPIFVQNMYNLGGDSATLAASPRMLGKL